ncbi:hypothetical protein MIR68_010518 [Amoeboaphelidium protococcarum]|nr:hypothetical protein MIR68_010518 [Amoeboaphelidium protococcarum]
MTEDSLQITKKPAKFVHQIQPGGDFVALPYMRVNHATAAVHSLPMLVADAQFASIIKDFCTEGRLLSTTQPPGTQYQKPHLLSSWEIAQYISTSRNVSTAYRPRSKRMERYKDLVTPVALSQVQNTSINERYPHSTTLDLIDGHTILHSTLI